MIILTVFLFLLFMAFNMPVAFSLAISASCYVFSHGDIPLMIIPEKLCSGLDSITLLALAFYILLAMVMNETGMTERLFNLCRSMIGHIKGGLAYVTVVASVIFAGISGSSSADAAGLGVVVIKTMVKDGYSKAYSSALVAAGATIGPIIPPSIIMIIYGVMVEVSVGRLFAAGFIPGLIMGLGLAVTIYFQGRKGKFAAVKTGNRQPFPMVLDSLKKGFLPMMTPAIILTCIFTGIVTATEAGIIGVIYSFVMGFIYKELNLKKFIALIEKGAIATGAIMIILAAANIFSWVVTVERLAYSLFDFIGSIGLAKWALLLIINLILLFLGCFIEAFAIFMITTPILFPIMQNLGVDPIHFGLFFIMSLLIGTITPPVGLSLYIVTGISGAPFKEVSKEAIPFILILIVVVFIMVYVPALSLTLPNLLFGR